MVQFGTFGLFWLILEISDKFKNEIGMRKIIGSLKNKLLKSKESESILDVRYYNNGFYDVDDSVENFVGEKSTFCCLPDGENRSVVWILENDNITIDLIGSVLSEYKTRNFTCGKKLLEKLKYEKPNLILIDTNIKDTSGHEVCRQIRKQFSHYEMPIIFMAGKKPVESIIKSFNLGANDIIFKPVISVVLYARVRMQLMVGFIEDRYVRLREFSSEIASYRSFEDMVFAIFHFLRNDRGVSEIALFEGESISKSSIKDVKKALEALKNSDGLDSVSIAKIENEKYLIVKSQILREFTIILKCYKNPGRLDLEYFKSVLNQLEVVKENIEKLTNNNMSMHIISEIKLNLKKVKYIKSESPYCLINYKGKKDTLKRISLSAIKLHVGEDCLIQIHKQILVNPNRVTKVSNGDDDKMYCYIGDDKLPIGKAFKTDILKRFKVKYFE